MKVESDIAVWVWDHGRWLAGVMIEPGEGRAMVRLNGGVSVAVPTADIRLRDPAGGGTDKPPCRIEVTSEIGRYAAYWKL